MDDFRVILGLSFFRKSHKFLIPSVSSIIFLDEKLNQVTQLKGAKESVPLLSALKFKKRAKDGTCYVVAIWETLEEPKSCPSRRLPIVIQDVLKEYEDVMPVELPKRLTPRREVDHQIELEPRAKPHATSPYWMAPPELAELRKNLKELLDARYI